MQLSLVPVVPQPIRRIIGRTEPTWSTHKRIEAYGDIWYSNPTFLLYVYLPILLSMCTSSTEFYVSILYNIYRIYIHCIFMCIYIHCIYVYIYCINIYSTYVTIHRPPTAARPRAGALHWRLHRSWRACGRGFHSHWACNRTRGALCPNSPPRTYQDMQK